MPPDDSATLMPPANRKMLIISDVIRAQVWVIITMDPNGNIQSSLSAPDEAVLDGLLSALNERLKVLRDAYRSRKGEGDGSEES